MRRGKTGEGTRFFPLWTNGLVGSEGEEAGHWICEGRESKAVLRATRGKKCKGEGSERGGGRCKIVDTEGSVEMGLFGQGRGWEEGRL